MGYDDHEPEGEGASRFDPRLVDGIQCVQDGKYDEAIPLLKAMLRENEACRDAWYGLGYCYYKHGNYLQSRLLFERALDLGNHAASEMLARIEYRLAKDRYEHGKRIPPSIVSLDGTVEYTSPSTTDDQLADEDEAGAQVPFEPHGEQDEGSAQALYEPCGQQDDTGAGGQLELVEALYETDDDGDPCVPEETDEGPSETRDSAPSEEDVVEPAVDREPAGALDEWTSLEGEEEEPEPLEQNRLASPNWPARPTLSDETPYPDLFSRLVSEPGLDEDDDSEALLIGSYDFAGSAVGLWGIGWAAAAVTLLTGGLGLPFGIVWILRYVVTHSVVADTRLEFRGKGISLFGWYLAFAVPAGALIATIQLVPREPVIQWPVLGAYGVAALFAVPFLFTRWVYSRMYWRQRRFMFEADFAEWFGVYTIYLVLCPLVSLGLLFPWGVKRYILWECRTVEVAGRKFRFRGRALPLLGWMALNLLLVPVHVLSLGFTNVLVAIQFMKWLVKNRRFVDREPGIAPLESED